MGSGLNRFDVPVSRIEVPLPSTVAGIQKAVGDLLEMGAVQAIDISIDKPIVAYRAVPETEILEDADRLDAKLSTVEILEYRVEPDNHTPIEKVFGMMAESSKERGWPVCFLTGPDQEGRLGEWLRLSNVRIGKFLLGVPIVRSIYMDEGSLVLCCSDRPAGDIEDIKFAVRTNIELRRVHAVRSQTHDRDRNSAEQCDPAVDQVEVIAGGGGPAGWVPTLMLGK